MRRDVWMAKTGQVQTKRVPWKDSAFYVTGGRSLLRLKLPGVLSLGGQWPPQAIPLCTACHVNT